MEQLKLKSKRHVGSGNFEYTYQCFCDPKPLKDIVVTYGNSDEAEQDAQMQCDAYCSPNSLEAPSHKKLETGVNPWLPNQSKTTLITEVLTASDLEISRSADSRKPSEAWDWSEEVNLEGTHGRLGKTTLTKRIQLPDTEHILEWNQELVKKDNDTGWDFRAYSSRDIEWTIWANNCAFSCDEITLRIMYRVVPNRVAPAAAAPATALR